MSSFYQRIQWWSKIDYLFDLNNGIVSYNMQEAADIHDLLVNVIN